MSASHEPLPKYRAQLATLVDRAPSGEQWLHELKYDGYRIGCAIDRGNVQLQSRRDRDWTSRFPEIVEAAKRLPVRQALLDGEIAIVMPNGTTSFQALQNAFSGASREGLTYFVFDLLALDGRNIAELPLETRKRECEALLAKLDDDSPIRYSRHFLVDGPTLLRQACELGAEGIVSKRRDQPYRPGRNEGWLKARCTQRQEFVIGGFTDPEGSRTGIGALLVGIYENGALRFAGKVGTGPGFTVPYLARMRKELERLETHECPFAPRPPGALGRQAHWLKPVRVGEVAFSEWTQGGHLRHGSFQGFRDDKPASAIDRERVHAVREAPAVRGVTITTPERLVYPDIPFTKLDLATLYSDLADRILPYIADRPLTLVRCEKGVRRADALRSECKFLRHEPGWHRWVQPPIRRVHIQEQKKMGEYLVVDSAEGLVALVQGDILEIHVWNSRVAALETPDRLVFDLDPGASVPWASVVDAARSLREQLAALGLESWPKLSGGNGVHVVVPFRAEHDWAHVYAFSRAVAEAAVRAAPESLTLEFAKAGRAHKILIDYKRNHRAAVAVAAYSARARRNGSLSVPVTWRELEASLRADHFTVQNVRERVGRARRDPWKDFWTTRQRLRR